MAINSIKRTSELLELKFAFLKSINGMPINHYTIEKIVKPIKVIQNTMKDEYRLFLRKAEYE